MTRIETARSKPAQDSRVERDLKRVTAYTGILSRIARRLDLHPSHVQRVARGLRVSPKVALEISNEVQRIEADLKQGRAA